MRHFLSGSLLARVVRGLLLSVTLQVRFAWTVPLIKESTVIG